jgi:hypothetical protein
MTTALIRCTRGTRAGGRRCSPWLSGGRSRRSPSHPRPTTGCRFPKRWSLAKLADFLVAEGVVEDISHEGLRALLRAEGVSFQAVKTWKQSNDPDYAAKKAQVERLYALADGKAGPGPGDPWVVFCVDEFGPLNLQPQPGRQRPCRGGVARGPGEAPRRRIRATYHRTGGIRHLFAALELGSDKMYGHIKKRKRRGEFLEFCRYLRSLHPPGVRIAIVCDLCRPRDYADMRWA